MKEIKIKKCSKCGTKTWLHMTTDNPKGPFVSRFAYCIDPACGMRFPMDEYKRLEQWKEESPYDRLDRLAAEKTMGGGGENK